MEREQSRKREGLLSICVSVFDCRQQKLLCYSMGYSKPKGFNTENRVLTKLLKGLEEVLWPGPLRASTRNHCITRSKETATWVTVRKLGTKKTAPPLGSEDHEAAF